MREYQLQCTTSRIGERKKRSTLLNAIDRLRYSATRREYCHPHLVGAPHKRKSLFFIMSRICFGFFLLQTYTRIFLSSYGNGKEQQVTKAFYNCFANASFHRPNQIITICPTYLLTNVFRVIGFDVSWCVHCFIQDFLKRP